MNWKQLRLPAISLAAVAFAAPAQADLITNGGFETGDLNGWTDAAISYYDPATNCGGDFTCEQILSELRELAKWLVPSGSPYSGSYYARAQQWDAVGKADVSGPTLFQTLSTAAGTTYEVSFAFNGTGSLFWDGIGVLNISNTGWTQYTLNVLGDGSNILGFRSDFGLLDDVSVNAAVAVPGPLAGAGLPGLILAGGGLLGWMRRRKAATA